MTVKDIAEALKVQKKFLKNMGENFANFRKTFMYLVKTNPGTTLEAISKNGSTVASKITEAVSSANPDVTFFFWAVKV